MNNHSFDHQMNVVFQRELEDFVRSGCVDEFTGEPMTLAEYAERIDFCEDAIFQDAVDRAERTTDPDVMQDYWGRSRDHGEVLYFASGTNHVGEIVGMLQGGGHVGVAVPELNAEAVAAIRRLGGSIRVFVDSGAFSEVGFGPDGPFIERPIADSEWRKRLDLYVELAEALGGRLYVVAPDCVAHQKETLKRLERYANQVRRAARLGVVDLANVIVPVQKGATPMAEFWKQECAILGDGDWIAGIPMKKDATSIDELEAFARDAKPRRIHMLGLGPESPRFDEAVAAIRRHVPDCAITCDSVMLRRLVGRTNGRGGGPRALTARRDELVAAGWSEDRVAELKQVMVATVALDRDAGCRSRLTRKLLDQTEG